MSGELISKAEATAAVTVAVMEAMDAVVKPRFEVMQGEIRMLRAQNDRLEADWHKAIQERDENWRNWQAIREAARWFLSALEEQFHALGPDRESGAGREYGTRLAILRAALAASSDTKEVK